MVTINKLSDDTHLRLLGHLPKPMDRLTRRQTQEKLSPFGQWGLTDGNSPIELPLPSWIKDGNYQDVIRAATKFSLGDHLVRLDRFQGLTLTKPTAKPLAISGWQRWDGAKWHRSGQPPDDTVGVLDFETVCIDPELDIWVPSCCVFLSEAGLYVWQFDSTKVDHDLKPCYQRTISFSTGSTLIGHNCVPLDTEALTREGWKPITEVKAGEEVLGFDGYKQVWTTVNGFVDGGVQEVIQFGNSRRTYKATKGHRWLAQRANGYREYGDTYEYLTTSELFNQPRTTRLLTSSVTEDRPSIISPDEAALIAWVWSDGSLEWKMGKTENDRVSATITQSKQLGIDSIEALLTRMGIRLSSHKVKGCDCTRYYIPSDIILGIYRKAGLSFSDPHCYSKFVTHLSNDGLKSWLDAFILAEGTVASFSTNAIQLSQCPTANPGKRDAIFIAAQLLGYNPQGSGKSLVLSKNNHTGLRTATRKSLGLMQVGCLNTETSNWVMRQGEEVTLTGNCPYDRQWLSEEYTLGDTGNRFFDTMSAFIACRGMSNQQRTAHAVFSKDDESYSPDWVNETARNSLDSVYQLATGETLDKGVRDDIVKGGIKFTSENLDRIVWYCIDDVYSTAKVFNWVYPQWLKTQPSPTSRAGQLNLGSCVISLSKDRYPGYYDRAEAASSAIKAQALDILRQCIADTFNRVVAPFAAGLSAIKAESELWEPAIAQLKETLGINGSLLADLDWTPAQTGKTKGLPKWYRDLTAKDKADKLSTKTKVVPYLLGIKWRGEYVYQKGTGEKDKNGNDKWGWATASYGFIPHPEDKGKPVTDLFAKGFVKAIEDGLITSDYGLEAIAANASTINWVQFRKRARGLHVKCVDGVYLCIPQMSVTGTATRRATDSIFQVLANPKPKRIGTEFKSLIEAPDGWAIVGADWDQQELWLAGSLGDAQFGYWGTTPLSVTVLIGTKEDGTDAHTKVVTTLLELYQAVIDRDVAKVLNFATLYGQGLKGCIDVLLKADLTLTLELAKAIAEGFIKTFKGRKSGYNGQYVDGLASDSFNRMEEIAFSKVPKTPLLRAKMPEPLRVAKDYATTKVNWTIQSFGVDIRDMIVTLVPYLFHRFGVDGRLMLTIHDEYRFRVRSHQATMAAYCLQLAHLITVAAVTDQLGLDCIPAGIAYFSAIDVDHVLRKEPNQPCITPSQPDPISPGYKLSAKDLAETPGLKELVLSH